MVSDIIQQTNSIVEKVDLNQAQMNGKILNYMCLGHLLLLCCIVLQIMKLQKSTIFIGF